MSDNKEQREALLEKAAAKIRLDEQQQRWPEIHRTLDRFAQAEARALRRDR